MAANHVQKKKLANFLSLTRHTVAKIIKHDMDLLLVRTNYLQTLLTSKHTHTCKQIYFLLAKLYFPQRPFIHYAFYLFSHSVLCILNCLLFNVRSVLFHFFYAIIKICGGNNIESNTRKIRTKTHSHAYPLKLPQPADKHKRIRLHARSRTIISGYGRNWLSPLSF